jgi:hypothetical protein
LECQEFQTYYIVVSARGLFPGRPVQLPFTYLALDMAFPKAKFILSMRDNEDQWYDSLIRFHTQIVDKNRIPSAADLQRFPYRYEGYLYRAMKMAFHISDDEPYERENWITRYRRHNEGVMEYFSNRPDSLLVVNVPESGAAKEILNFLGLAYSEQRMPHLNRSS